MSLKSLHVLGLTVLISGIVGAVGWLVYSEVELVDALTDPQVRIYQSGTVTLHKGRYTIYYEDRNFIDSDDKITIPAGFKFSINELGRYKSVPVDDYNWSFDYQWGTWRGKAVYTLKLERYAPYEVEVNNLGYGSRVVIRRAFAGIIVRAVVGVPLIFFLFGGIGVTILTLCDRKKIAEETGS